MSSTFENAAWQFEQYQASLYPAIHLSFIGPVTLITSLLLSLPTPHSPLDAQAMANTRVDTPTPPNDDLPLDIDIWTEVLDQLDAPDIAHLAESSKRASHLVSCMSSTLEWY